MTPLDPELAPAIRSRQVDGVNGLSVHILEAGFEADGRPLVLLLHGFPELAYSWRKVMPALAAAGFHVVAPDMRGYGRTTGWDPAYDADLEPFRFMNLAQDCVSLVEALGRREVACVVGHDFGSPVAGHCALTRPDIFRSVVMMSAPFEGAPAAKAAPAAATPARDIHADLAALPRPRKLYHWYYGTRPANEDMWRAPQGVAAFLRAYYHVKSADWPGNRPHRLPRRDAESLAILPDYYAMPLEQTMAQVAAAYAPSAAEVAACGWLTDDELAVYAREYSRTGFQGGLQWYRCATSGIAARDLRAFAGRTIDVPSLFIAGAADWGVYQTPGSFERMQTHGCTRMAGAHLIPGAGHWVQQEQPQAVADLLLGFLAGLG
ncbi:alpha/beta hydrolase [uncultured Phenylobacterium sp.]|uniref:alpha/beta hydrolase n=1 Tax=uncultured Phenylobacterium sp. TaxID=349273 RepID=UPI0025FD5A36|nr:alpha/beta hydrolase [uncultured Phenylobacterium sp.]